MANITRKIIVLAEWEHTSFCREQKTRRNDRGAHDLAAGIVTEIITKHKVTKPVECWIKEGKKVVDHWLYMPTYR